MDVSHLFDDPQRFTFEELGRVTADLTKTALQEYYYDTPWSTV